MADSSKRRSIAILLGIGVLVNYFDRVNLSVAHDALQKQFGITDVTFGYLLSSYSWTYAAMQLPCGSLLDRFGVRRVMLAAVLLWALASGLSTIAPTIGVLFVARYLLGIGEAPTFPANAKAIGLWFPERRRGVPTATFDAAAKLAIGLGTPFLGFILLRYGLRVNFGTTAILSLVYAGFFAWIYRDPKIGEGPGSGRIEEAHVPTVRVVGFTSSAKSLGCRGRCWRLQLLLLPASYLAAVLPAEGFEDDAAEGSALVSGAVAVRRSSRIRSWRRTRRQVVAARGKRRPCPPKCSRYRQRIGFVRTGPRIRASPVARPALSYGGLDRHFGHFAGCVEPAVSTWTAAGRRARGCHHEPLRADLRDHRADYNGIHQRANAFLRCGIPRGRCGSTHWDAELRIPARAHTPRRGIELLGWSSVRRSVRLEDLKADPFTLAGCVLRFPPRPHSKALLRVNSARLRESALGPATFNVASRRLRPVHHIRVVFTRANASVCYSWAMQADGFARGSGSSILRSPCMRSQQSG